MSHPASLIHIAGLSAQDVRAIWSLAAAPARPLRGTVGWSFEGNGIRTRTTFIQAFRDLGLAFTELPNLLKTDERAQDLAGYLDPFYDAYVVRESDPERLRAFAAASSRPVINAMSRAGHPCEVLSDAFHVQSEIGALDAMRIGLWGPTTNVLRSWQELAGVLGFTLHHFCPAAFHQPLDHVRFHGSADTAVDLLVTDGWPGGFADAQWTLTEAHMRQLGNPRLLPTPPFTIGNEVGFDPAASPRFAGYEQKRALVAVQRAILSHALADPTR